MSLTRLLNTPEFRTRFREEFQKPTFAIQSEPIVPILPSNPTLVGIAYDYVLRFMLERRYPVQKNFTWAAENSLQHIYDLEQKAPVYRIISKALTDYQCYLSNGKLTTTLLRSALKLAKLDIISRAGIIDENLGGISKIDLMDLNNVVMKTNLKLFKPKKTIILNPTFGYGSQLVGGADADIIVDNRLIEIKTTKSARIDRDTFNQLLGYYILSVIGDIDQVFKQVEIKELAVYYSRFGQMISFKVNKITSSRKMSRFINWFQKKLE